VDESEERLLALGRLAGSVVHDSNNLLLVIAGHVELARRLLGDGHPAAVRLFTVLHAVERASALNRQLLSFGRSTKEPEVLADLDALGAPARADAAPAARRLRAARGAYGRRPRAGEHGPRPSSSSSCSTWC
jgi:signal transduction histidine kinase